MSEAAITVDCVACVPPIRARIHGTLRQVLAVGWVVVKGTRSGWNCPRCSSRLAPQLGGRLPGL